MGGGNILFQLGDIAFELARSVNERNWLKLRIASGEIDFRLARRFRFVPNAKSPVASRDNDRPRPRSSHSHTQNTARLILESLCSQARISDQTTRDG